MPVANLANMSPDLTYDHTIELLAEAYDCRLHRNKVVISAIFLYLLQNIIFTDLSA